MENIYHIHQSSNSYWESHWTDTDYFLCDSEEEYQKLLAEYKNKREEVVRKYKEDPDNWSTITHTNGVVGSSMLTDSDGMRRLSVPATTSIS